MFIRFHCGRPKGYQPDWAEFRPDLRGAALRGAYRKAVREFEESLCPKHGNDHLACIDAGK